MKIESEVAANIVSIDDAIKIAESFEGMKEDKDNNSKNLRVKDDKPKKVKETKVLKSKNGVPNIYILNYEDAGFMIMSADERFIPVLAYVEDGKNFSEESRKQNYGLHDWLNQISEMITNIQEGKTKPIEGVEALWNKQRDGAWFKTKKGRNTACYGYLNIVPPLLSTQYHQFYPYNSNLNAGTCFSFYPWQGKPPVGCVATAITQLMAYHDQPNYNWNDMNSIANANRDVGLSVYTQYDCFNSIVNTSDIPQGLSNFGFYGQSWYYVPYGISPIENDLLSNRPVLLRADDPNQTVGHAWLADGVWAYHQACPQAETFHLHMNWGFLDGDYNGWYFSTNWNSNANYTINQYALVNINKSW